MSDPVNHKYWMAEAINCAKDGLYSTWPNPAVGCVIVKDNTIVGQGVHIKAGQAHAEINALHQAKEKACGATAYVTLEPCSHHGRTGPCAQALIAAEVKEVIVASLDPNPKVNGEGVKQLQAADIDVKVGVMQHQARALNLGFFSQHERKRPWVRLKMAMSLDGRTALHNGKSQWITSEAARADGQKLRAMSSAIVTGSGTVLYDDPQLTVRIPEAKDTPKRPRMVIDSQLITSPKAQVFDTEAAPTYLLHAKPDSQARAWQKRGVQCHAFANAHGKVDLSALIQLAYDQSWQSLLIEAGSGLSGAMIEAGYVDELWLYQAPILMGQNSQALFELSTIDTMMQTHRLNILSRTLLGDDVRMIATIL